MTDTVYHLTQNGLNELQEEKNTLIAKRGEVAQRLATARSLGDLSENAEYDSAKEEKNRLESRVREIESIVKNAKIITPSAKGVVSLGNTVTLKSDSKEVTYTVVGKVEADPSERKISDESPIGKALLNKKEGDSVEIVTPKNKIEYVITKIS